MTDRIKALEDALTLAANRLHRVALDFDTGSRRSIEALEWADEARAALAASQPAQAMQNPATSYGNPGEIVAQRDLAVRSAQKRSAELDAMRDQMQELRRKANASEARASHLQSALDRMKAQPLTVQDAARVPEIAALIEAATAAKPHIRGALGFTLNAALRAIAEGRA